MTTHQAPTIPLPKAWNQHVKTAVLHVVSLAQYATSHTRGWAADGINPRVRLQAELDRANQEIALLREQLRINKARMKSIPVRNRPHHIATERMAILELKAARGWSLQQAADQFLVTSATIAFWMKRIVEPDDKLVRLREPVNKFPGFVRYAVQRLKVLCPTMGKVKIAATLCRAGLHLGKTTAGRILKENPVSDPGDSQDKTDSNSEQPEEASVMPDTSETERVVTAKYRNHVWHVDLTIVPILGGFWTTWSPFALPQCLPFCCGLLSYWITIHAVVWESPFSPSNQPVKPFAPFSVERFTTPRLLPST